MEMGEPRTPPWVPAPPPPLAPEKYSQAQLPVPPAPAVSTAKLATTWNGWFVATPVVPLIVEQIVPPPRLVAIVIVMALAVVLTPIRSTRNMLPCTSTLAGIVQKKRFFSAFLFFTRTGVKIV